MILRPSKPLKLLADKVLSFILLFNLLAFFPNQSFAQNSKDRIRTCIPEAFAGVAGQEVKVADLSFKDDFEFEVDNEICLGGILTAYLATKVALTYMDVACLNGFTLRYKPSIIQDQVDISKAALKATRTGNLECARAASAAQVSFATFSAYLLTVYEIANNVKDNIKLCGADWKKWNPETSFKDMDDVRASRRAWVQDIRNVNASMSSKEYREWYYDGKEFDDKSDDEVCYDVTTSPDKDGVYPPQKYYMRGSQTPNYNCDKYNVNRLAPASLQNVADNNLEDKYNAAYQCCLKRSRENICIQYQRLGTSEPSYKFCKAGEKCSIESITFSADFKYDNKLICANTYSLCPYNFNVGGGTTECDYFKDSMDVEPIGLTGTNTLKCNGKSEIRDPDCTVNKKAGKCKNYCQMLENCVVVDSSYHYESSISSPYFSRACMDFSGDSRNGVGYDSGIFAGKQMHFTAPIAQCVRETLENVFYNRAGHSQCLKGNEVADENGKCFSGAYIYAKGDTVKQKSFFASLQDGTQLIVKMMLTLMITITGIKILLGGQLLKRSEVVMMVVKIAVVAYFAAGDAWQTTFFNGIYNGSSVISNLVMKINVSEDESRRDGCQFGTIALTSGANGSSLNTYQTMVATTYPAGKEYLAIWDTLDCKIARYLGFGPTATTANIAKLIFAGIFTGPIGIYFSALLLVFGFFMIIAALRALHIFLVSSMSIILMVYVSVITIPTILFKKTENIFKQWVTNLIGFSLQPIMLFAYVGIFITAFDQIMLGSATFLPAKDISSAKSISCDEKCYDLVTGRIITTKADGTAMTDINTDCDPTNHQQILRPEADSVACIVNVNSLNSWPGFEVIGIALPMIKGFGDNAREKILTLMKAVLLIYILGAFIDQIPSMASGLIGGRQLATKSLNINKMLSGARGVMSGIAERGAGAAKKGLKKGKGVANDAREAVGKVADKGAEVKEADRSKAGDPDDDGGAGR